MDIIVLIFFSDMSHSETRMSLFIDGLEFHVYNRTKYYARLEKLFGLKPTMIPECDVEEPAVPAR